MKGGVVSPQSAYAEALHGSRKSGCPRFDRKSLGSALFGTRSRRISSAAAVLGDKTRQPAGASRQGGPKINSSFARNLDRPARNGAESYRVRNEFLA